MNKRLTKTALIALIGLTFTQPTYAVNPQDEKVKRQRIDTDQTIEDLESKLANMTDEDEKATLGLPPLPAELITKLHEDAIEAGQDIPEEDIDLADLSAMFLGLAIEDS